MTLESRIADGFARAAAVIGLPADWAAQLNGLLVAPQAIVAATKAVPGILRLATDAEVLAALVDTAALTPKQALSLLNAQGTRRGTNAQRLALTGADLIPGGFFYATDTGILWKYVSAATGWKGWDSDWQTWTNPQVTGFTGSLNADPGWGFIRVPEWRYNAGRVTYRGTIRQTNGSVNSNPSITVALPVLARTQEFSGDFKAIDNSTGDLYLMSGRQAGSGFLALDYWSPRQGTSGQYGGIVRWGLYGNTPITWADADLFFWDLTYDQA